MAGSDEVRWRNPCVASKERWNWKVPSPADLGRVSQIRFFFLNSSRVSNIPAVMFRITCTMARTPVLSVSGLQRWLDQIFAYFAASITQGKGKNMARPLRLRREAHGSWPSVLVVTSWTQSGDLLYGTVATLRTSAGSRYQGCEPVQLTDLRSSWRQREERSVRG